MISGIQKLKLFQKEYLLLIMILIMQVFNLVYWAQRKEGYAGDELYSYQFVCQTNYPSINGNRPEMEYLNNWHNSSYYIDYYTLNKDEMFNVSGVYRSIMHDVHPPIFYILLNISCSLFGGDFTKWSGLSLNILFFILTIFFLHKLAMEITDSMVERLAICGIYGFSIGAVSTVMFIRMYMILTFAALVYIYLHALLMRQIKPKNAVKRYRLGIYLLIYFITIFGLLTQFYFVIFAFFVSVTWWMLTIYKKDFRQTAEYTGVMFAGLLTGFTIWPRMYEQIFKDYRGIEAFNNLKNSEGFFKKYCELIQRQLFGGTGKLIFILMLAFFVMAFLTYYIHIKISKTSTGIKILWEKNTFKSYLNITYKTLMRFAIVGMILFTSISYILLISKIAPYCADRYVFMIYPLVMLLIIKLFVWLLGQICAKQKASWIGLVLTTMFMLSGYKDIGVNYIYTGDSEKIKAAKEMADLPIVMITHNNRRFTTCVESIYFLFGQEVYPTDENGIDTIQSALDDISADSCFLLYIDQSLDEHETLDKVQEKVPIISAKWLYNTQKSYVYKIEWNNVF